jgi:membrane protein CcdC involved in cytochrome C biogenesis
MDDPTEESLPTEQDSPIPRSFMLISAGALVWNLLGVAAYISQVTMSAAALAALPEGERLLYETIPVWATSAFAVAVNGSALGCILLLFKKSWAYPVLFVSLLGVLVQMVHSIFIANSIEVYGPGGMVMPVMVVLVSAYLVWFSRNAWRNGWIS